MKMKKCLSAFLALAMIVSLFAVVPVFAADESETPASKALEITKYAADNGDGTFTVTLEAFATGSKVVTETSSDVPTDIVLVLDQSGSMAQNNMSGDAYVPYSNMANSNLYRYRHNGGSSNLWYLTEDGQYVSVSVNRVPVAENLTGKTNNTIYNDYSGLYIQNGNESLSVSVSREYIRVDGQYVRVYTYTLSDGTTFTSDGNNSVPDFSGYGDGILYGVSQYGAEYEYTYSYVIDGLTIAIGESLGNDTAFATPLYQYSTNGISRLQALKNALVVFANSVYEKAKGEDGVLNTDDDVKHRVAVVGFGRGNYSTAYLNTEVLIGSNQYIYPNSASAQYGNAFQDMSTQVGQDNLTASIDALDGNGGTYINLGMTMAKGILDANPLNSGEKRNRVVVVFTDGSPGYNGSWDDDVSQIYGSGGNSQNDAYPVANAALSIAKGIKDSGVTVYTVGVFDGADASNPSSPPTYGNESVEGNANRFMHALSTNYPNATAIKSIGQLNENVTANSSYYLSASDAGSLTTIFQKISNQVSSSVSSTTLGASTEVRDVIAPSFTLPEGTTSEDISIASYPCTWVEMANDGSKIYTFGTTPNDAADNAYAIVNGDNVDVTNFDFAGNYCGTNTAADGKEEIVGSKLVISFVVTPKDGFVGGNDVPTNTHAGVYENSEAEEPVMVFPVPTVNVPIIAPEFLVNDKTIYEGGSTAVSGLYTLPEITEADAWKYAYVNVSSAFGGEAGETVSPADCTGYDVKVTYEPKTDGSVSVGTPNDMAGVSNTKTATVHVLKPDVTAQVNDVVRFYGESYSLGSGVNGSIAVDWTDGNSHTQIPAAEGTAPYTGSDLTLSYSLNGSNATSFQVPKADTDVQVSVKKGNDTVPAVITTTCDIAGEDCAASETDGLYTVHYATGSLTLTKAGGNDGESYVFHIYKDGKKYTEITIVGNASKTIYELPAGTYTIQEDTGWSWRFQTVSFDKESVTISAATPNVSITCTNTKTNDNWLNYFTDVITNIFGEAKK